MKLVRSLEKIGWSSKERNNIPTKTIGSSAITSLSSLLKSNSTMSFTVNNSTPDLVDLSSDFLEEESLNMSGISVDEESPRVAQHNDSRASLLSGSSVSSTSTTRTVELVAPANLPKGYQFVAEVDGDEYLVQVPQYGVYKGQRFNAPIVREGSSRLRAQPGHQIPTGAWRNGLFSCFAQGVLHPVWCLACWCSPLLLGQVMTRLNLNAAGEAATAKEPRSWSTFGVLASIFAAHFVLIETLLSAIVMIQIHEREAGYHAVPAWAYLLLAVRAICRTTLVVYFFVLSFRTRQVVRERYELPVVACGNATCEDCLVSVACHCCSIAQMARHTADYQTYDAKCCSATGLSDYAPAV
jgi:Cys-rich protein (TIGR01571 family)